MSVYRELAAELQATKAMVDSLSGQNQHLNRQNQMLRQEIHRVVQVTLQLGQYAGVAHPSDSTPDARAPLADTTMPETIKSKGAGLGQVPLSEPPVAPIRRPKGGKRVNAAAQSNAQPVGAKAMALVPKFFTEQSGETRRYALDSESSKELSGLWLMVSIVLIIFTAFGAGFLIMRPLLNDR